MMRMLIEPIQFMMNLSIPLWFMQSSYAKENLENLLATASIRIVDSDYDNLHFSEAF